MFKSKLKQKALSALREQLEESKSNASHFYKMKSHAESAAFSDLSSLAKRIGVTAQQASKTEEGIRILSEVVLNRQWAFYHNEQSIQIQAKINEIEDPNYADNLLKKDYWFEKVVKPAGYEIVCDQIDLICGPLISEVDEQLC